MKKSPIPKSVLKRMTPRDRARWEDEQRSQALARVEKDDGVDFGGFGTIPEQSRALGLHKMLGMSGAFSRPRAWLRARGWVLKEVTHEGETWTHPIAVCGPLNSPRLFFGPEEAIARELYTAAGQRLEAAGWTVSLGGGGDTLDGTSAWHWIEKVIDPVTKRQRGIVTAIRLQHERETGKAR